jgi:transposase
MLSKAISFRWDKLNNIHSEIANQVSVLIRAIGLFHGVTRIKFEDLRWRKNTGKYNTGYYLTANQMHFIHGQIISKTEELLSFSSTVVEFVNARWTSQMCSHCYKSNPIGITYQTQKSDIVHLIGIRDRAKFIHDCETTKKFQSNSDLNAARNIALAPAIQI